jgi:general secretion pathway protein D
VRAVLFAALLSLAAPAVAGTLPSSLGPVRVQLDSMPTGALVTMLMRDVMGVPYVISSDVLADQKPVSVNLVMARDDLPVRVVAFLRSLGLVVRLQGGTVFVSHKPLSSEVAPAIGSPVAVSGPSGVGMPSAAYQPSLDVPAPVRPPVTAIADEEPATIAVIEPAHRAPDELAEILRSVLPGISLAVREASSPRGDQIVDRLSPSVLVISGTKAQISMASQLVRQLDKPRPSVSIRAVLFEVRTSKARGSALSVLGDVLGGRLGFGLNSSGGGGDHFVKLATGGVSAVLSAVRTDARFQVVAEPSLSALSGATATINSGSQVPTIGEVTYSENGAPIRSVVYRDSGVSLTVSPTVRRGEIELRVTQERSTFAATRTGVNDTPTLNKSSASSTVAIAPGETIAIAGLDERSDDSTRDGFFGGFLGSRQRDEGSAQLLLLIQADLAQDARKAEPAIDLFEPEKEKDVAQADA